MNVVNKLTVCFDSKQKMPTVDAVQGDIGRAIQVSLYAAGVAWVIPSGAAVLVRYRRSDGAGGTYDTLLDGSKAWIVSGNTVTVALVPQMLAVAGLVAMQVSIVSEDGVLSTFTIKVQVETDPSIGTVQPEDYVNIENLAARALSATLRAEELAKSITTCIPVDFEAGSINTSTGADASLSTRIRSGYFPNLSGKIGVAAPTTVKTRLVFYNEDLSFHSSAGAFTAGSYQVGSDAAFARLIVGYVDDSEVADVDALASTVAVYVPVELPEWIQPLPVTITGNDTDGYTADKRIDDIQAADEAGQDCICLWDGLRLPLVLWEDATAHFAAVVDGLEYRVEIGQETVTAVCEGLVPTSRTINGHALSEDVTLTAEDVGAADARTVARHNIRRIDLIDPDKFEAKMFLQVNVGSSTVDDKAASSSNNIHGIYAVDDGVVVRSYVLNGEQYAAVSSGWLLYDGDGVLRGYTTGTSVTCSVEGHEICYLGIVSGQGQGAIVAIQELDGPVTDDYIRQGIDGYVVLQKERNQHLLDGRVTALEESVAESSKHIVPNYANFSTFGRFATVGDSLSVGTYRQADGTDINDDSKSWGAHIAKNCHNERLSLGFGGATTTLWIDGVSWTDNGLEKALLSENECGAYIIALGYNDCNTASTSGGVTLGTMDDIDTEDPDNNAVSYYGNMDKILRKLHGAFPDAKLFVLNNPYYNTDLAESYNTALAEVTARLAGENVYLIDLYGRYNEIYAALAEDREGNHYHPQIYQYMGMLIATAISDYMQEHFTEFKYAVDGLTGTDPDKESKKRNGWIATNDGVYIDTEAKTLTFGGSAHILYGGHKVNVANTIHDISDLAGGAFMYFDPATRALSSAYSEGAVYLGAMWAPWYLADLPIQRDKLFVDGLPVNFTARFLGKAVNVLGDSMTYGTGTTKIYHEWLPQLCGFATVNNYGVAGSSIAPKVDEVPTWEDGIQSLYERYTDMGYADAIIVFGGVNDWVTGRTLGTMADTDTTTFYGAMKALCAGLIQRYPVKPIYVFSSPQNDYVNRPANDLAGTEWEGNTEGYNRKGLKLQDYTRAMGEVCAAFGIPFCSLTDGLFYGLSGVLGDNNGTSGVYGSDGLHPNAEGHKRIALKMAGFINSN